MVEQDDFLLDTLRRYGADAAADDTLVLAAASLRDGTVPSAAWSRALPEPLAQAVVLSLKDDADRHWRIHWEGAYVRSLQIIAIGEARTDLAIQALGTMAKGDAVKLVTGRLQEAWELLEHAGNLYRASHLSEREKEIGWARTRIGRLAICVDIGKSQTAFVESEVARQILERYEVWVRLIPLHVNWAQVYDLSDNYQASLRHLEIALQIVTRLGKLAEDWLTTIYNNLAITLRYMGQTQKALYYYEQAVTIATQRGEVVIAVAARMNMGFLLMETGHLGRALRLLFESEPILLERSPRLYIVMQWVLIRCYIELDRFDDARDTLTRLLAIVGLEKGDVGRAHFLRARIETKEGTGLDALASFEEAERIYSELGRPFTVATVVEVKAYLKLQMGLAREVLEEQLALTPVVEEVAVEYNVLANLMLITEASILMNNTQTSITTANKALKLAKSFAYTPQHYRAHIILGDLLQATNKKKARRHYQAATAAIARIQKGLSYTLSADMLGKVQEGFHRYVSMELSDGRIESAFSTIESYKSRLFLTYLQRLGSLKWVKTAKTEPLLEEWNVLRARHFKITQSEEQNVAPSHEVKEIEKRLRQITERLYLYATETDFTFTVVPNIDSIQRELPVGSALLEYYDDGTQVWLFVIRPDSLSVYPLSINHIILNAFIESIYENHVATIAQYMPDDIASTIQAKKARRIYTILGEILFTPIINEISNLSRLYIVPYGLLHKLPFNLLRIGNGYLIEQVEVVTLPSAALLHHKGPYGKVGNRWIGHSYEGRLPDAVVEVEELHRQWGGELYTELNAKASILHKMPCQVLHLSTHGIHRVDHYFDRSFIQLSDQYLYGDDLLQSELPYELVTLSACEAGASKVAPGVEQIGLGRTFLYAGVGALVASFWKVREEMTRKLMEHFYANLFSGATKSSALQQAQVAMLSEYPTLHPVYWGSFQLIGNPQTLS